MAQKPQMNPKHKNLALWIVIGLFMILVINLFNVPSNPLEQEMVFSDFVSALDRGEVSEVTIKENAIAGRMKDGTQFRTYAPHDAGLIPKLREQQVRITVRPADKSPWYVTFLLSWGPMLLIIALWIFFIRQMQTGGNRAMSFGKSRAQLLTEDKKKVTFADVAGVDEAKVEVQEIVEFLKDPPKFQKLGGRIPKGVLVVGPPGTGKTLLARAIAGEAGVPFLSISGSDFVEMFVGVGASRVRDLFEQGRKNAPCIIFIDEIDAVGRLRGAGLGGGHDEREQTLNQLLVEMDGFETTDGVILVAATNRPDVLDPALLRPGRFDRQVYVGRPDIKGRLEVLKVHSKKVPLAAQVDLEVIARGTPGFAGADLENLVNEAALLAARRSKSQVEMLDFEDAKDKILMGVERKSAVLSEEEKRNTAYHEAGHAVVAKLLPGTDPVHKVTVIPRGQALGVTMQLPTEDRYTYYKDFLVNNLAILMGGRIAEEVFIGRISTGAGNDIEKATELARKMVTQWGMSEELGPLTYGQGQEEIFLGREIAQHRDYSEATAVAIDTEVRRLVTENYERAKRLIIDHKDGLVAVAEALIERETLDAGDLDRILGEHGITQEPVAPAPAPA
jgi:cell division protease FtsH